MRFVVDTNVIVSGLLNGSGRPGQIVDLILSGGIIVVYSEPILREYREVLLRKKFPFTHKEVATFLGSVIATGDAINPSSVVSVPLPDRGDIPFVIAALDANCPLITGNLKHFPKSAGVEVLSPRQALERLGTSP